MEQITNTKPKEVDLLNNKYEIANNKYETKGRVKAVSGFIQEIELLLALHLFY